MVELEARTPPPHLPGVARRVGGDSDGLLSIRLGASAICHFERHQAKGGHWRSRAAKWPTLTMRRRDHK